jgi:hypothetical protein
MMMAGPKFAATTGAGVTHPSTNYEPSGTPGVSKRGMGAAIAGVASLVVVAGIIVSLGIGGAVLWALQERGRDSSTSASDAASAGVRPAVRAPAASALALTPPAPAPASAAIPMPAPSSVASPVTVERPAATAPPAASATSASVEAQPSVALPPATVAATPAPPPPARPHRNPATAHVDPSPTEPKVEAPRHASSARCSDILQKASLEPLTAEEADYLRRECR